MAVLLHVQLLEAGFAMHAWMRGTFGTVGLVLVGLLLALFAVAPTARADVYDPADWAPSVWSDKADYAPGELVTLSGAHWQPGETVNVVVNDDAGQTWRRDVDVTADDAGGITDSFNLPEHFVAVYSVRATGASSGAVASTSFTDGNVKVKTNANGFTFRLDWTRHNGTNTAPQKTCTAVAAAQTNGFDATVGFSGGNQFSEGVPADSSIVLDAADTASNGHVFEGWTGETAGDTFLTRTDPHEICVRGDFTGSRTYVANYAVNSVPAVTRDTASRTVDEGQTATNTGTWSDANALDTVTLSASVGTVTKNSDGTWSWSYATTDGPGQSQTVTITATDSHGGRSTTSFALTVDNVAPIVTLAGLDGSTAPMSFVDEGSTARTFTFTVVEPGLDGYTVKSGFPDCGEGDLVAGSLVTEAGGGSFECRFPDGAAAPTVRIQVRDADEPAGSSTADSNIATTEVHVRNVAPSVTLAGPAQVDENTTDARLYSFSVSDPGQDGFTVASGFPSCGTDGSLVDGSLSTTASGGSFECRFPDGPANPTVSMRVRDADEPAGSMTADSNVATRAVSVANVAPMVSLSGANDLEVDEASAAARVFRFTASDAGADELAIDAGCGDHGDLVAGSVDGDSFECVFADGDAETDVSVSVDDGDGGTDSDSQPVTVANVAPSVSVSGVTTVDEGDVETYTYSVSDPGTDAVSAVETKCGNHGVKVPDSDSEVGTTGTFECRFPDGPDDTTVSAKATDSDGDTGEPGTLGVHVSNVAPLVTLTGAGEVEEGDTETYSYSVEDPGQDSFTVEEHFPDCDFGATDNGVLVGDPVKDASGGSFQCRFPDGTRTATVKIKVTDSDGASTTDSEDVVVVEVANVAPALSGQANQTANEGTAKSFDLGSFTDQGDDADWTVHVEWGDESSDLDILTKDAAGSLGALEHTFADGPRTYTVTVTVSDKDGAEDSATFDVEVANVAPTLALTGPTVVREGETRTYGYEIAEPGDDAVQSVQAGCGDAGELVDGSHQRDGANGSFDCFFPDGTAQSTVSARATDDDGDTGRADEATVDVANIAPVVHLDGDTTASEGTTHTYTFTVADPGDDTWHAADQTPDCDADGSTGMLLEGSYTTDDEGGSFRCSFPDGPANPRVRMKVADEDGASDGDSESVRVVAVSNVVPQITPPADQPANEGASTSFELGSFADPGPDAPWVVDIGWGDGSPHTTFTVDELGSLGSRSHTYPNGPASKTVTITVTDDNGDTGTSAFEVDVANVAPTASNPKLELDAVLGTAKASFDYADAGWLDKHDASFFTWNVGSPLTTVTPLTASFPAATGTASSSQRLSAGCYSLTVAGTAKDNDGGQSAPLAIATNHQFSVHASGFRPPIMDNERNIAKYGNVVPVKVVLTDRCTNASVTSAQLFITLAKGTGNEFIEDSNLIAESVSSADTGSQMRVVDGMYMFNLSTKGLQANMDYAVRARLGSTSGPVLLQAVLQPKK
jgi:hypothetical protein